MYSTVLSCARQPHICKRSVDLPIPGSPPSRTSEPFTRPPPSTLSSSDIPVSYLVSSLNERLFILESGSLPPPVLFARPWDFGCISVSSSVFQAPQALQRPLHFGYSCPHSLHIYTDFDFAIFSSFPMNYCTELVMSPLFSGILLVEISVRPALSAGFEVRYVSIPLYIV